MKINNEGCPAYIKKWWIFEYYGKCLKEYCNIKPYSDGVVYTTYCSYCKTHIWLQMTLIGAKRLGLIDMDEKPIKQGATP